MNLTLHVWRQKDAKSAGKFVTYKAKDISPDSSFLEMMDIVNQDLIERGEEPVAFDHDCREGICGTCSMVINGIPHGPQRGTTTCQLHMRKFKDGAQIWIEPFRARAFPVLRDLVVDRSAFERIQQAGIAGLGGAVFPTHSKLDGRGQLTEILIINGLECEPYITTDDRLMQEYADEIMDGIRVLKHLLKPKLTLIGVEDNKPAAIDALTRHATDADVLVKSVPTKYPSGGAKQTIELLTGRQPYFGDSPIAVCMQHLTAPLPRLPADLADLEPVLDRMLAKKREDRFATMTAFTHALRQILGGRRHDGLALLLGHADGAEPLRQFRARQSDQRRLRRRHIGFKRSFFEDA